jgi:antitoxin component YwqK of YwqJK toxin-antitoxin module
MKQYLIILFSYLIVGCGTNTSENKSLEPADKFVAVNSIQKGKMVEDRTCDCSDLRDKLDSGLYLYYKDGEKSYYSGKCKLTTENGNEITYKYQNGHILEIIERYPSRKLNEEMYYDLTGKIIKRVNYYPNGCISYKGNLHGDHSYERFYENGKINRKGCFGFYCKDSKYLELHKNDKILFDSIWKENGQFDSVCHYSRASITY